MGNILLIEDDKTLNRGIKISLEKDHHIVTSVYGYTAAMNEVWKRTYDLILMDINLPDGNGYSLCEKMHQESITTPVIFITANDTEADMLRGFKAGCDDYITKPFSVEVLRRKVMVILKRVSKQSRENVIRYKDLTMDMDKKLVTVKGEPCHLTPAEYKLLEYMIQNKGRVLTRDMLLSNLWDAYGNFVDENTLRVQIKRLRQKIEADPKSPEYVITVFGIGYTFGSRIEKNN
ncbi:MAG TPA: response regulator transcription factor [Clostridiales bacterium]|nr:response regulator transcription factor [Clostridiales bacterium]